MADGVDVEVEGEGGNRKIAIAVDLSEESAYAVKWAMENYLREGDTVILLHVRSTSVLYGADWGANAIDTESQQKLEDDFDAFTSSKASDLARPLVEGKVSYPLKIHIVKDHDMKERICLEVERLGVNAVIMGSRGIGASKRNYNKTRLGSVSDYCVHHCVCPVVVVRFPEDNAETSVPAVLEQLPEEHEEEEEEQVRLTDAVDEEKYIIDSTEAEEQQTDEILKEEQQTDSAQDKKQHT